MTTKKCMYGHYYNADQFSFCPYCADKKRTSTVTPNGRDIFSSTQNNSAMPNNDDDEKTVLLSSDLSVDELLAGMKSGQQEPVTEMDVEQNSDDYENESAQVPSEPEEKNIDEIIKNAVVGWLICIEGAAYGEVFPLHSGTFYIGRSPKMDIVLDKDPDVVMFYHATIIYDPENKEFSVQPGESMELYYKNKKPVNYKEKLEAYDTLTIGKTKLLFFPLCGSEFSWDEIKEEKS